MTTLTASALGLLAFGFLSASSALCLLPFSRMSREILLERRKKIMRYLETAQREITSVLGTTARCKSF
jgi:hypothetical protein